MRIFFLFLLTFFSLNARSAITYEFSGGRFGDNLLSYLHAKWMSLETGVPLLYRPFRYSSSLVLHNKEEFLRNGRQVIDGKKKVGFSKRIFLGKSCPKPSAKGNCLFICPYFPEVRWELEQRAFFYLKTDWKNAEFRKVAREMIAPNFPCDLYLPPEDCISIALHLRDGGYFDDYEFRFKDPLKMPPITFYVECLKQIIELFKDKPLYCRIFSDSIRLNALVKEIQSLLPRDHPIRFAFREKDNSNEVFVLEDFFSLFHYDVLIRPTSNFSIVPTLIHDYALVFYPDAFTKKGEKVIINKILIEKNEELLRSCFDRRI